MILAMETYVPCEIHGEEKGLKMIKDAGFDGVDYTFFSPSGLKLLGDDYIERASVTKSLLQRYNLVCNQAHAPFLFRYEHGCWEKTDLWLGMLRSIEYAAFLGAKHIVVHPVKVPPEEDFNQYNLRYLNSFATTAKRFGIRIAVENGGDLLRIRSLLRMLDPDVFVCCVDTGHANAPKQGRFPQDSIAAVPKGMLQALHINDNRGLYDGASDIHFIPYLGTIDWDAVLRALAQQEYSGDFTLEIVGFLLDYLPQEVLPEALVLAHAIGRLMIQKYNEIRKQ